MRGVPAESLSTGIDQLWNIPGRGADKYSVSWKIFKETESQELNSIELNSIEFNSNPIGFLEFGKNGNQV